MENKPDVKTGTVTIHSIKFDKNGQPILDFSYDKEFEEYLKVVVFKKPHIYERDIKKYVMSTFIESLVKQNADLINKKKES